MSSLKTLFVAAILVAGIYGVYLVLNYNPETTALPEITDDWPTKLDINPGTAANKAPGSAAPQWNSDTSASAAPMFASSASEGSGSVGSPTPVPTGSDPGATAAPFYPGEGVATEAPPVSAPMDAGAPPPFAASAAAGVEQGPPPAAAWPTETPSTASPAEASGLAQSADLSPPPGNREDYATFTQRVNEALAANQLAAVHLMLSQRYTDPGTAPDEARQIEGLLDQLAGTVIYSPQSFLEAPYEVLATDTLESIAERYNVPPGLLVKINRLDPQVPLQPGQQIKVVRGPFEAIVNLDRGELTLLLEGERYAGRFPISIGPQLRQEGIFMVSDKQDLTALASGGMTPPDGSLGTRWIGLNQHMGLHGTNQPEPLGRSVGHGCISLGRRDIEDLYDILSIGSRVVIRR